MQTQLNNNLNRLQHHDTFTDNTQKIEEILLKQNKCFFLQLEENKKFLQDFLDKNHLKKENLSNLHIIDKDELKTHFNTNIKIIALTGTNGKTTTAALIYSLLLDLGYSTALLGTRGMFINDQKIKEKGLTTPMLLDLYKSVDLAVHNSCQYFVMEVSSHAISQDRIYGLEFYAKIITNITSDHLDYHKSLQNYIDTKIDFMKKDNCIKIINLDDKNCARLRFLEGVHTYAVESNGNLSCKAYSLKNGIFANLTLKLNSKDLKNESENFSLDSNLQGKFNIYNIMAAILAIKLATGKDIKDIVENMQNFSGVSGRMEVVNQSPLIIVDFAHTVDGMEQIFDSLRMKNIIVVFGAGGNRDRTKRPLMGECAEKYAKKIFITNDNPRFEDPQLIANEIYSGINNKGLVEIILNREEAIKKAINELFINNDYILVILGKGDENTIEIEGVKTYFNDKECVHKILEVMKR